MRNEFIRAERKRTKKNIVIRCGCIVKRTPRNQLTLLLKLYTDEY